MFRQSSLSDGSPCRANACFTGYAIDLLAKIADDLGFEYIIYEVDDGKYGARNEVTKKWDGVINELIPDSSGNTVGAFSFLTDN